MKKETQHEGRVNEVSISKQIITQQIDENGNCLSETEILAEQLLPEIDVSVQDLKTNTSQAWDALIQANTKRPFLFRRGGLLVRINRDDNGNLVTEDLTVDRLKHELARKARWYKPTTRGNNVVNEPAKPPTDVVKDMLATPTPPLPVLERIVEVPVFAANGTLQTDAGYHSASRTYYDPVVGFQLRSVPEQPEAKDIAEARSLILDELITDFPFATGADRAHAVGLFLLPFSRDLIRGQTPNHIIEASTPGTGKSLLSDVLLAPAAGHHIGMITQPQTEDEWRKNLTSQFMRGHPIVLIDNLTKPLDSGTFAGALTAPVWMDRLLGGNATVNIAVRCVWVTTANNPAMSTEIARRSVRIRLDANIDRPWQREGYRHENLKSWVSENRSDLVWAALVLIRAWLAAGKPRPRLKPLGSYEEWSFVIGGILEVAGISDFLSNLNEFYDIADIERAPWEQLVAKWWEKFQDNPVTVAELFPLTVDIDGFHFDSHEEQARRISFGKQLAQYRDRVMGDFRINLAGTKQRAKVWKLKRLNPNTVNVVDGQLEVNVGNKVSVTTLCQVNEDSSITIKEGIEHSFSSLHSLTLSGLAELDLEDETKVETEIETFDLGEAA